MKFKYLSIYAFLLGVSISVFSQSYRNNSTLLLENIMKGELWMGTSPDNVSWSPDGEKIYFTWNPEENIMPAEYAYIVSSGEIKKLTPEERSGKLPHYGISSNTLGDKFLFSKNGDLFLYSLSENKTVKLLDLNHTIQGAKFSPDERSCSFTCENNLFRYYFDTGRVEKLTDFVKGKKKPEPKNWSNEQEEWLYKDQYSRFDVLKERKERENLLKKRQEETKPDNPLEIFTGDARIMGQSISGDWNYNVFLTFSRNTAGKQVDMPRYVTGNGFTKTDKVRSKVGYPYGSMELGIYDRVEDTVIYVDIKELPGIFDYTVFAEDQNIEVREAPRDVYFSSPVWNPSGTRVVVNIRSTDNKDRWITSLDYKEGSLNLIDRQRDEAWIGGPGIGWSTSSGTLGWIDDNTVFFQSEKSGYSHLYSYSFETGRIKMLTRGKYEVYDPFLSRDKKYFYFHSNEVHPGERHFYRMDVNGKNKVRLSYKKGRNDCFLSPDESKIVIRHSFANEPWELYVADNQSNGSEGEDWIRITDSYSDDFKSYTWRIPEFIRIKASDGEMIPARLYRPASDVKNGAAVIFVHGAGYLQNAHKWWSSYYREYMFHNFLVDNGYTVLDMDYRASAGYGRDWRTAIYRHMGGKDLSDQVDGAGYLRDNEGIDSDRIGIYGGSYGGFMTLMALFNAPETFAAGAALRPVTDWAHYNHGYTSNILNTPFEDSLAYQRSSPINFADGLEGHLVMCHGMVDDNVHFQDVVRLSQRLIELQKDNWELAPFPMEAHGFKHWTSWLDEYKRVYKIFEENILPEK